MSQDPTHKPYFVLDGHDKMHWLTYQTSAVYTQVTVKARGSLGFIIDSTVEIYFVQYSTESYYYSLKSK